MLGHNLRLCVPLSGIYALHPVLDSLHRGHCGYTKLAINDNETKVTISVSIGDDEEILVLGDKMKLT